MVPTTTTHNHLMPDPEPPTHHLEEPLIPDEATTDLVQFAQFIETLPADPKILHDIASALRRRFESSRNITIIDCAILAYDRAADLTPPEDTAYIPRACDATLAFILPFDDPTFTGRRDRLVALALDISRRVTTMKTLVAAINGDGHPLAAIIHQSLANLYYATFELSESVDDLSRCISSFERAASLFQPRGGKEHRDAVFILSACLLQRFQLAGDICDYTATIKHRQELIDVLPSTQPDHRATTFEQQAATFLRRSIATRSLEDIESAIECQRQSLALTPRDLDDHPRRLCDLSILMASRGERTRNIADIDDAIAYVREAIDSTPLHYPERLSNLASHLSLRASFTRDAADMSSAIEVHQQAISAVTPTHPRYATMLRSLGTSFMQRYRWTNSAADLSYAISAYEEAIKYSNHGRAQALEQLARHLNLRFQHYQHTSQSDIDKAISNLEQSINLTAPGDPNLPSRWDGLAFALSLRFGLTADPDDINHSIYLSEKALSSTPENHAKRPKCIFTLSSSLFDRFDSSSTRVGGDPKDLDRAIALSRECLAIPNLLPGDSVGRPMKMLLAVLLARRYTRAAANGQQVDLREAQRCFIEFATDPTLPPTTRTIHATLSLTYAQDATQTLQACALAISLYPEYVSLDRTIEERYALLETSTGLLGRSVASCALKYGEKELAVEWIEQARCLVWTQLDGFRPPPSDLDSTQPELAEELAAVGAELRAIGSRTRKVVDGDVLEVVRDSETFPLMRKHMELAKAWDSVVGRIRESEGFSSFLKPMKINEYLEKAPKEGPVVILTASMTRADAIALVAGKGFIHIPLHDVNVVRVEEMKKVVWACLKRNGVRARDVQRGMRFEADEGATGLCDALADLWTLVVEPILTSLEYLPVEDPESRPRIWWCPAGPFGFLPIHAAGIYGEEASSGSCVLDYVISSYTPNITMLLKKQTAPFAARPNTLLLVSQPATPDLAPIPATKQEAEELQSAMDAAGIPIQSFTDGCATLETIKHGLAESTWAHFACHAAQDIEAPLRSGLYLHDGRLELSSMMDHLPNAEHAFLSACQTSMGYEKLNEEAVHIAAGMLAAGYRGVVGTMWSIADSYGPIVSKAFYAYLLEKAESSDGGLMARLSALELDDDKMHSERTGVEGMGFGDPVKRMDCTLSARALHVAIQALRDKVGDSENGLLTWVPYVHFGV